nr:DoxX family protein [uncultured Emticicia sp.]
MAVLVLRLNFGFWMIPQGYNKPQEFLVGKRYFPYPPHVSPIISHRLTIFAEFFCSIFLALGLLTRTALIILIGCMTIITFSIHGSDPLGDKEHALLYLFTYFAIFLIGAGKNSIGMKVLSDA